MEIRALRPGDNLANFRTGDPYLDLYFRNYATQDPYGAHLGVPYLALASRWVIGGACVAPAHLILEGRSRPMLRLARLAVDRSARGQGVGAQLLRFALLMAVCMECEGVVADARGTEFFSRFGFTVMELEEGKSDERPRPVPMFLSTRAVSAALARCTAPT